MQRSCLEAGLSRRDLVLAGARVVSDKCRSAGWLKPSPWQPPTRPDAALNLLIEGNARYVANQPRERDFSAGRACRSQGLPACDGSTTGADRSAGNRPSLVCADSSSEILTRSRMWLYRGFWSAPMKGSDYRFP